MRPTKAAPKKPAKKVKLSDSQVAARAKKFIDADTIMEEFGLNASPAKFRDALRSIYS